MPPSPSPADAPGVLPRRLSFALKHIALPPWVAQCCGLSAGSSVEALGSNVAPSEPSARAAVDFFAVELLRKHANELRDLTLLPPGTTLDKEKLQVSSWPTRARNAILRNPTWRDPQHLDRITYGDLFKTRGLGTRSAIELALHLQAMEVPAPAGGTDASMEGPQPVIDADEIRRQLRAIIESDWSASAHKADPRWSDLLAGGGETLAITAEAVLAALESRAEVPNQQRLLPLVAPVRIDDPADIQQWCARIYARFRELDQMSLEHALSDLLERCTSYRAERRDALLARFGWTGMPPVTLEEAGQRLGVTRERIRQLENSVKKKLPPGPVLLPALERAMAQLATAAPIPVADAAKYLQTHGISDRPFSPESVIAAGEILGLDCEIEVTESKGVRMVTTVGRTSHLSRILRLSRRKSGATGVVNCADVAAQISRESSSKCSVQDVQAVLKASPTFRQLDEYWFWATDLPSGRNRVVNMCRKMLSVTSPISVRRLRDGMRREFNFRNSSSCGRLNLTVPPTAVLRSFLDDHPDFVVDAAGDVRPATPLDYRVELGESDRILVDVFRSSPTMVLDRTSVLTGCAERGANLQTASIDLTYSCVIEHLDVNIWTLRGADINPAAVEALRRANALRPREKRVLDFGWTPSGRIWIAAAVPPETQTFVIGCPAGARPYLISQKFEALTVDELPCGTVAVTDEGTIYGLGPFVQISGADAGDLLIMEFDIAAKTALLRLGDEELLESYGT